MALTAGGSVKPFPWRSLDKNQRSGLPEYAGIDLQVYYDLDATRGGPRHPNFPEEMLKAESYATNPGMEYAYTLRAICWVNGTLVYKDRFPPENALEWVLRVKRVGRTAIKTMREAGEEPALYFPRMLPAYEKAFAD